MKPEKKPAQVFATNAKEWLKVLIPWARERERVNILEIGSSDGECSRWFLDHLMIHPQSRLTCAGLWQPTGGGRAQSDDIDCEFGAFQKNCQASGKADRVTVLKGDSAVVLQTLPDASFDLVYVGGDRDAAGVYFDSLSALRLAKPNGMVLWDGCFISNSVKAGVDLACRALGIAVERLGNNMSYRKPQAGSPVEVRPAKIVGLLPVRNEEARIQFGLRALAQFTDAIVCLDDNSTDQTVGRIEQVAAECRVERILRNEKWFLDEPGDRNRLLQAGRETGGTHFIVLDADEAFTANCRDQQMLRKLVLSLRPGEQLAMTWIQLWRGLHYYRHDSSVWTNNLKSIAFCDDGQCSYQSGFVHTPRVPATLAGERVLLPGYQFGVLHFQFVNWRDLLVKQAWYHCMERVHEPMKSAKEINSLYAPSVDESALEVKPAPYTWLDYPFFDPAAAAPPDLWRKTQVMAWFDQFGVDLFRDLDIRNIDWPVRAAGAAAEASLSNPLPAPRVSVLVSTCNSEQFIRGCLEDLEAQTIASQLEIIVVDSGSGQNEGAVVREFQQRHKNIIYLRTERETLYGAWNRAIGIARAPYLTNANTDDRHAPDALEKMAAILDLQPSADLVYANCAVTETPNAPFGAAPIHGCFRWPPFDRRLLFSVCFIGPQPMWRRSLHDRFGLFDAQFTSAGDYDFWLRISHQARFVHLPQTLGLYLEHAGSIQHLVPLVAQREAETARRRHWPKEWGRMPKAEGNFFQPVANWPAGYESPSAAPGPAPLVSVIIPTHSRPEMLRAAIASVLSQTFQDFEIIVINDGGEDIAELISHSEHPSKITVLRHDQRRERSAARNAGLAAARGKHVAYLDDDDIFYPDHLESLVSVLKATGKKVAYSDACCAHQSCQNAQYKVTSRELQPTPNYSRARLLALNFIPILCVMHEKSCLEAAGGFDLQLSTHEDWDLWIRLSRHFEFVHLKKVTCEFRCRVDGSSTTSSNQRDFLRTAELICTRYRMYSGQNRKVIQRQRALLEDLRQRNKPSPKEGMAWLGYRMLRPFQNIKRSLRKRLLPRQDMETIT